jgi:NADH-quinone oxidoreductase subunit K
MFTIGLTHYLVLAALLFCFGVLVMITKRNAVGVLLGAELVLNASNVNLVAFSRYQIGDMNGQILALFGVVLAAAEAAIAIAIFVNYYHETRTIDVDKATALQG